MCILPRDEFPFEHVLPLPAAHILRWHADANGLHLMAQRWLNATPGQYDMTPKELAVIHPDLHPHLRRITQRNGVPSVSFLYAQLQHLFNPVSLPELDCGPVWLRTVLRLFWLESSAIVGVTGRVYDVHPETGTVTNFTVAAFDTSATSLDALVPGWRERYLIAQTMELSDEALVQYVGTVQPAASPVPPVILPSLC